MTTTQMEIASLRDVMTLGDVLAKSGFFQDARGAAQAVVKVLAGRELGFGPIASMTGVHIVKGKPVMSAMLIAAAIKRSGKYDYKIREHTKTVCKLEFFESGSSAGESSYSIEEAKAAGLGGANWEHFPKNMLFARAVSNGAKWFCPDIFGGPVYTPDELGIDIDGETGEVKNLTSVIVDEVAPPRLCDECAEPLGADGLCAHDRAWHERRRAAANPSDPNDEERQHLIAEIKRLGKNLPMGDKAEATRTYGIGATLEETDTSALAGLLAWMRTRVKK